MSRRKDAQVTTMTVPRIDRDEVLAMALAEGPPIPGIDGGTIGTREQATWRSDDGSVETGVWECDAGRFRAEFAAYGELFHVVGGEVECTGDDGSRFTLRPGDAMTFPRGWTGEWHVRSPLRKVYATWQAR
jgi:uncharacterized cupin superfamily protein